MNLENKLKKSCQRIRNKTIKVSKKLFGIDTFPLIYEAMFVEKQKLEKEFGKDIKDFNDEDIAKASYSYAKWKTLNRLCEIYLGVTQLIVFDIHDVMEELNKWMRKNMNA